MHMYWLYDLPTPVFAMIVIGGTVTISLIGLMATRPLARRVFGPPPAQNDLVGDIMQAASAFYGITLGLIAVGAWSASQDASDRVGREAAELGGLYRDVTCMPQPVRADLEDILRRYTRYTIDEAWPMQRRGIVPKKGVPLITEFLNRLSAYEPQTKGSEVFMREVLTQFNTFHEARRMRLQAVDAGMPAVLWVVVFAGAAITIIILFFLVLENIRVHALYVMLLSGLLALLIFITAAMDNPFRGAFGLGPEAFELTYQQLMTGGDTGKQ